MIKQDGDSVELSGTADLLATLNLARRQGLGCLRLEVSEVKGEAGDDGAWEMTRGTSQLVFEQGNNFIAFME